MRRAALTRLSSFNFVALVLGLAFLYLPIVVLVIYSFNASKLVTLWGGWSLRWYAELFNDRAMLDAAWMSLRIALVSATAATVFGTLAAGALTRAGRFAGRGLFTGMVYAPLVLPEIITGLSLLLLFVALDVGRDSGQSRWRTPRSRCASSLSSCRPGLSMPTARWRKRRWISAARPRAPSPR